MAITKSRTKNGKALHSLTRRQISQLSNTAIAVMPASQLAELIETVGCYVPQPGGMVSIRDCDEATLLRMAYLARECCRHVIAEEDEHPEMRLISCESSCDCPHCG